MEYAALVDVYDRLAATESNNEKRDVLAETFADAGELLPVLTTLVRGRLYPAHSREDLGVSSSLTLEAVLKATGIDEDAVRDQWRETGDLGDAAAWAVAHEAQQTLFSEPLTVERVYEELRDVATYEGEGSQGKRVDAVASLVADADPNEARYVVRTALGHMRVGIGEGTIRDAIALAFLDTDDADGPTDESVRAVERAYQVTNDYPLVAETARDEGRDGLAALDIETGRPVQLMLAEKAESLDAGLADAAAATDTLPADADEGIAPDDPYALAEVKYDGARIQIHVDGDDVTLFTRRLEDVTAQFPDVVRVVERGVTAERAVVDGELVGYTPATVATDERDPVPFQEFSRRIKRESDIDEMAREIPVVVHVFDLLADDATRLDEPFADRRERLRSTVEPVDPAPDDGVAGLELARSVWATPDEPESALDLYRETLDAGHEGLMLKNPAASYEPGRRVGRLLKVKPTMEPLDLVVSRAKYSEGRRSDWLGRLWLACYDPETDDLQEVGRLSTGYTDEELDRLTDRLEDLIVSTDGRGVELTPEVVLEVEYEEIQSSPEYESGYALRFPRFLRVREDLDPTDADTLGRVESLYESQ